MMPLSTKSPSFELVESSLAYDGYASRYDSLLLENRINAYMRTQMMNEQRKAFSPGERLLEIGCGTGDEALELAKYGCRVVAVDPSEGMLSEARSKANREPFGARVTFIRGYARELNTCLSSTESLRFDGAYASFALSYEPKLEPVSEALAALVRPGGFFLTALMNRICMMEALLAMGTLHPSIAGRRLAPETPHKVGAVSTLVIARTVSQVKRVFDPFFEMTDERALPSIVPPAYVNRMTRKLPGLMDLLERIDSRTSRLPILRTLGDHTLFKFRRRDGPAGTLRSNV